MVFNDFVKRFAAMMVLWFPRGYELLLLSGVISCCTGCVVLMNMISALLRY